MAPLRILFVAPYVPSLTRVRPFNLIKQLAALGHRVTLCAVATPGESDAAEIRPYCDSVDIEPVTRAQSWWNCLRALPSDEPLQARYGYSQRLQWRIDELLSGRRGDVFDIVHIEHLRAAILGWSVKQPHVFDAVDCISQLFAQTATLGTGIVSRWGARFDLPRTRLFERRILENFARVLAISADERAALAALAASPERSAERIWVLPNGVDLEYFQPVTTARDPATLVFVGRMSYHANVGAIEFLARDILPQVWRVRPEVRLKVVGENPSPQLDRWVAASNGRIVLTGTVPDVRPHVAQATLAVCPVTYAVGMQNKILEAMATATPTITTPGGARGLAATDGQELVIAADADTFAAQILALLGDTPRRARLGAAGRRYVERAHDWRASGEQLEAIYREQIARAAKPATRNGR